eukprot:TRINITY_DN1244_c0_g1_i1.p1 TRINITY_DN1244_c0_g1~~TRINITY_DN1244_c0_g1_i1.p1  ORF type:complete len:215 (-),score=58.66 TRINITY_DN1244_c0_g1_i1:103-747(-)
MKQGVVVVVLIAAIIATTKAQCTLGSVTGCDSTGSSAGITAQIVQQLNNEGYSFRTMNSSLVNCPGWTCVLQDSAASALESAAVAKDDFITLNSAFRSSAEQYILYQWYINGNECGISLAAEPGQSNHEGGRAVDVQYYDYWYDELTAYGWTQSYPDSDPVHFDYFSATDISQQNLMAFQTLWNNNNPGNQITVDGIYGPDTANALSNTPCGGW